MGPLAIDFHTLVTKFLSAFDHLLDGECISAIPHTAVCDAVQTDLHVGRRHGSGCTLHRPKCAGRQRCCLNKTTSTELVSAHIPKPPGGAGRRTARITFRTSSVPHNSRSRISVIQAPGAITRLSEHPQIHGGRHGLVSSISRMQMIAAIIFREHSLRMIRISHRLIEVNRPVESRDYSEPIRSLLSASLLSPA